MILSAEYNIRLHRRESIIVFDEVQRFPIARQAIKYLVADGRYDYIETGSLISIKENVSDITIPSEERKINMYPMDFEEFANAMEENGLIDYIRCCFEKRVPLEQTLHAKCYMGDTGLLISHTFDENEIADEQLYTTHFSYRPIWPSACEYWIEVPFDFVEYCHSCKNAEN